MPQPFSTTAEFSRALPAELDRLRAQAQDHGVDPAALDLSYRSLDALEPFLLALAARHPSPPYPRARDDRTTLRVSWYAGQTLRNEVGADWSMASDQLGGIEPVLTRLPLIARHRLHPIEIVQRGLGGIRRDHHGKGVPYGADRLRPGWLRDEIEAYDIHLQRERTARLLGSIDEQVERFRADVRDLTGDALPAVPDLDSMGLVQRALVTALSSGIVVDELREIRGRAVLYIGTVFEAAVGDAEWHLEERPKFLYFGHLCLVQGYYGPMRHVRELWRHSPPDMLYRVVDRTVRACHPGDTDT